MPLSSNMTLSRIIDYLRTDLKVSIQNDIFPALQTDKAEGGYFSVPRLVLCCVDYLGALYCGFDGKDPNHIATANKAKKFLREVMAKADRRYGGRGDLLVEMYRHGTVHLNAPLSLIRSTDNRIITWQCYKGPRTAATAERIIVHLHPYEFQAGADILPISINCLYDDLLASIEEYCNLLLLDDNQNGGGELITRFVSAANALVVPKRVSFRW